MSVDSSIVSGILLAACGFFLVYYFLYRKYIFSIADPLFLHIFNASFSSVLVINTVQEPRYITHFFVCQLFLFVGFALVQETAVNNKSSLINRSFNFYDLDLLRYSVYTLFGVYICANLITLYVKGFALLSDNPNLAKVSNFQGGFGIFRKINWVLGSFLSAGLVILYFIETKRIYIVLLIILALFTALEGYKSSLMRIILSAVLLINHPYFSHNVRIIKKLKKYLPLVILAIAAVLYTVFSKNSADVSQTGFLFLQRLLYGADSVLYFYRPQNEYLLTQYNFFDYLKHITNPVLGLFRLSDYEEALGNIMVENIIPPGVTLDVIVGPNSPFYIEGQVYFGYYGAFLYSFFIGGVYSYIRQTFFSLRQGSFFLLALGCALCFHGSNILIESTLFITTCFDTCFFVIPVYVAMCFLLNGKIVIRSVRLSGVTKYFFS